MKRKIIIGIFVLVSTFGFTNLTYGCAISCAAICRYTCEGTPQSESGCGDADYARTLMNCCESAFRNTPGIEHVPCQSGPQA
jgi:hypothetical protein